MKGTGQRFLKLLLTDGVQSVIGFEYVTIPALTPTTPPGTKLVVKHPTVRRGNLMLDPNSTRVLLLPLGVCTTLTMLVPRYSGDV